MFQWLYSLFRKGPDFRFRILIVCRANITRSPFIEGLLRHRITERFPEVLEEVGLASAGVQGFRNAAADPVMRFLAQQYGVDLLPHSSRPITARLVKEADVILTLEESHARQIQARFRESEGKVFPLPKFGNSDLDQADWDVSDPTGKEAEEYDAFARRADTEVDRLLGLLEGQLLDTRDNLILIGNPGVGKTTVGKQLAEELDVGFLDTDDLIEEKHNTTLQEIVDQQGYQTLRRIEEETLLEISVRNTVIATGGSAVYSTIGMTHLRNHGQLIWLQAPSEVLTERIGDPSGRGLAKPADQTLEDLFAERNELYSRWAEVRVEENDVDSMVEAIRLQAGFPVKETA